PQLLLRDAGDVLRPRKAAWPEEPDHAREDGGGRPPRELLIDDRFQQCLERALQLRRAEAEGADPVDELRQAAIAASQMLDGRHRVERQTMVDRQRDPLERQQPLLRDHPARRREPSWSAARGEHAVAWNCDQERVAPEGLAHGPRRTGLSQQRRDLPVGRGTSRRQVAHLVVDGALEGSEQGEIERQRGEILRFAGEVTFEEPRRLPHERRRLRPVLLRELRPQSAGRQLRHLDGGQATLIPAQPHGSGASLEQQPGFHCASPSSWPASRLPEQPPRLARDYACDKPFLMAPKQPYAASPFKVAAATPSIPGAAGRRQRRAASKPIAAATSFVTSEVQWTASTKVMP